MTLVPIGVVIRAWRRQRRMGLVELAAAAGPPITSGYLSQVETGHIKRPGERHLEAIARGLSVAPTVLLTRELPSAGELDTSTTRLSDDPLLDETRSVLRLALASGLESEARYLLESYLDWLRHHVSRHDREH